jgi:hypothetical protein
VLNSIKTIVANTAALAKIDVSTADAKRRQKALKQVDLLVSGTSKVAFQVKSALLRLRAQTNHDEMSQSVHAKTVADFQEANYAFVAVTNKVRSTVYDRDRRRLHDLGTSMGQALSPDQVVNVRSCVSVVLVCFRNFR